MRRKDEMEEREEKIEEEFVLLYLWLLNSVH